jgi:hypothetical protein
MPPRSTWRFCARSHSNLAVRLWRAPLKRLNPKPPRLAGQCTEPRASPVQAIKPLRHGGGIGHSREHRRLRPDIKPLPARKRSFQAFIPRYPGFGRPAVRVNAVPTKRGGRCAVLPARYALQKFLSRAGRWGARNAGGAWAADAASKGPLSGAKRTRYAHSEVFRF